MFGTRQHKSHMQIKYTKFSGQNGTIKIQICGLLDPHS